MSEFTFDIISTAGQTSSADIVCVDTDAIGADAAVVWIRDRGPDIRRRGGVTVVAIGRSPMNCTPFLGLADVIIHRPVELSPASWYETLYPVWRWRWHPDEPDEMPGAESGCVSPDEFAESMRLAAIPWR